MGEIPSGPLFSVKLWFAVALLTSAPVRIFVGQVTSAPPPVSPPQKVSARPSARFSARRYRLKPRPIS